MRSKSDCGYRHVPATHALDESALDLAPVVRGELNNVRFAQLVELLQAFGFAEARVSGSHHIFAHPDVAELLNIQEVRGDAKSYQIRQFLRLVERYNLRLEDNA